MRDILKILLVDDSKVFWMYLRKVLEESDVKAEITGALNMTSGISLIKNKPFDCIILDYMLPDGNGYLILQEMRASGIKTPVIVLTGHGDEQVAVSMMKAGANDYIPKSQISPGRLSQSIRRVINSYMMEEHLKQVEKELKESKEFFESIVKTAKALIVGLDLKGFVSLFNYHCEKVTGWKKKDAIGKEWIPNFIPAKHRQQAEEIFKKIIDGNEGFAYESPILTIEGKERIIDWNYSILHDSSGNPSLFLGIGVDVTDRKMMEEESRKAEEALREAHAQIKQLLASISSILIGVSSNDLINQWNTAAEKSFGITAGEVLGRSFFQCGIQWDWSEVVKHLDISKEKNLPVQIDDLRYTRPDGKDGFLRLHINLIEDTAGRQWGYVLLGTDITEQKRIESQLALSQKMESIGQLAAGIAHEINTPMQYIGDNTRFFKDTFRDILDMLKKYKDILIKAEGGIVPVELIEEMKVMEKKLDLEYLTEETPRAIEQSLEGIDRVRKLILAMKDFSHPGRSEKSLSDINKAIESTVTISRNEWKYIADLETILDPGLPLVFCAVDQINQAVLNMIVNAAQAISEMAREGPAPKGKITIETSYSEPFVEITIRDTGRGIPQSIIHKIFDPFFTTKEVGKGTGQGLTISHDIIVNKHKGTIEVYSEVGKGTVFVIKLPVHSQEGGKQVL